MSVPLPALFEEFGLVQQSGELFEERREVAEDAEYGVSRRVSPPGSVRLPLPSQRL
jgi:hypothetical protein